jgi:RNA polymerase sigma-70 factor (ECF subfamily)
MSDEELLQRALQGDQEAFAELYNRYFRPLFVFARRIVRRDAEDIAQETFVRVLTALPQFDPARGTVRNWLFTIARRLAIDALRRLGRELPPPGDAAGDANGSSAIANIPDLAPTPEEIAIVREHRAALNDCLDKLTPQESEVAILIYMVGFKFEETAAILEIPIGTVMSRSGRARAKLRQCLKRKGIIL